MFVCPNILYVDGLEASFHVAQFYVNIKHFVIAGAFFGNDSFSRTFKNLLQHS